MTSIVSVPKQIGSDTDWKTISGGGGLGFAGSTGDHYLALKQNNELFSWGVNTGGALGNNSTVNSNVPKTICNIINSTKFGSDEDIRIFPNPSNDVIFVDCEDNIDALTISNILGQEVKCQINSKYIDVSTLENGTYFLKIEMPKSRMLIKSISIVK
jgi:alpha-tubulin suppressor-like RCC1 family protein